jgi:hypothetical protein
MAHAAGVEGQVQAPLAGCISFATVERKHYGKAEES